MTSRPLTAGVIEGFYGPPWTWDERREIVEALADWGGDEYVWAPKSAPHHRDAWREPFDDDERSGFDSLRGRGVAIRVGLTPGADATADDVIDKLRPVVDRCDGFVLCFDDLDEHEGAGRHATITNAVRDSFGVVVRMVPTHYAGTTDSPYLRSLVDELHPDIEVMWTGSTVVCDTIAPDEAMARAAVTGGRLPLLWDNTPVNDALMRDLLHLGPYAGRPVGLREHVAGVLCNPMEFARASRPTIRSAVAWARGRDHLVEWRTEIDALGLGALAEATAFPGDPHWPGEEPGREWWLTIRDLPAPDDERLARWVDAARDGASLVLSLLDIEGSAGESRHVGAAIGGVVAWRAWRRLEACALGRGPRLRPVFTQDESGRFAYRPGTVADQPSLVDRVASRVLGD